VGLHRKVPGGWACCETARMATSAMHPPQQLDQCMVNISCMQQAKAMGMADSQTFLPRQKHPRVVSMHGPSGAYTYDSIHHELLVLLSALCLECSASEACSPACQNSCCNAIDESDSPRALSP
jgi:hypothetical protein